MNLVSVKDLQGRFILINRCYEEVFHVKQEALIGKTLYDLSGETDADIYLKIQTLKHLTQEERIRMK